MLHQISLIRDERLGEEVHKQLYRIWGMTYEGAIAEINYIQRKLTRPIDQSCYKYRTDFHVWRICPYPISKPCTTPPCIGSRSHNDGGYKAMTTKGIIVILDQEQKKIRQQDTTNREIIVTPDLDGKEKLKQPREKKNKDKKQIRKRKKQSYKDLLKAISNVNFFCRY